MLLDVVSRRPGGGALFGLGDARLVILLAVLVLILVITLLNRRNR